MRLPLALALFLALAAPLTAQALPAVSLAWDAPVFPAGAPVLPLSGYQLQRCLVPSGQSTCTPQDLAGVTLGPSVLQTTDLPPAPGLYVYAVVALCATCTPSRSEPSNTVSVPFGLAPVPAPTHMSAVAVLPQSALLARADSQETQRENGAATNAVDGNLLTFWHTQWGTASPPPPHWLQLDLPSEWTVAGLRYLPRQDGGVNGTIASYRVEVSRDGQAWQAVASGTWPATGTGWREVRFAPVLARAVRLWALAEVNGKPWSSAAEVQLIQGSQ